MITHSVNRGSSFAQDMEQIISVGKAFKILTFIVPVYAGVVTECTPTQVFVSTPGSVNQDYTFEGSEEDMRALVAFATSFRETPAEPGSFIRENLLRARHVIREMFQHEQLPDDTWASEMKHIMKHLDAGMPVGPLT